MIYYYFRHHTQNQSVMREYANKPESQSCTLNSNPRASRQAPIADILQAYKNAVLGRQLVQRESVEDEELLQTKTSEQALVSAILQRYKEIIQRFAPEEEDELLQGKFETTQREDMDNNELLQGRFESRTQTQDQSVRREKKPNNTGLPDNLKTGIENLSGYSMDDVNVHYNSDKPAQLNALAYAQGTNIHVAPGQEKHLPHEAWHVVQQKQGRVQPTMQLQGVNVNDNEGLEKEADVMGEKVLKTKQNENELGIDSSTQMRIYTKQGVNQLNFLVFQRSTKDNYGIIQLQNLCINANGGLVAQLISNEELVEFQQQWEEIEKKLDVLYEFDSQVTLELVSSLEEIRSILQQQSDKINGDDLKNRMDNILGWIAFFGAKFDRESFAFYKLLGSDGMRHSDSLKSATSAIIYRNGQPNISSLGTLCTSRSDFPGQVYLDRSKVSIINILGDGRLKEAKSYLKEIGIKTGEIVDSGIKTDDIIKEKIKCAEIYIANKEVSLSIMPLSTIAQAKGKVKEIIWSNYIGGDSDYQFEIIHCYKGKTHFIADIKWANGILVENLIQVLNDWKVRFESINLFGIAGSLIPILGPNTLVVPRGEIHSLDPDYDEPVSIPWNNAFIPGAMLTMDHGNVSSILEETDDGVRNLLLRKKIHVVEMEAYHLVKKLESMKYTGKLKIVFKIHDVVTSETENISIPTPQDARTLIAKQERDNIILEAFEII